MLSATKKPGKWNWRLGRSYQKKMETSPCFSLNVFGAEQSFSYTQDSTLIHAVLDLHLLKPRALGWTVSRKNYSPQWMKVVFLSFTHKATFWLHSLVEDWNKEQKCVRWRKERRSIVSRSWQTMAWEPTTCFSKS